MPSMNKTKVFAVLVIILILSTYYFEFYSPQKEEDRLAQESKIIQDLPEQIHQVQVENSKGKVLLKRDAEGWTLLEPFQDWADNQFVEDFVSGLTSEKSLGDAIEQSPIDWGLYGLDKDYAKVTFTNQLGKSTVISVSTKKNFEGNSFVRRDSESRVLLTSSQWAMRSQSSAMDFRDKRLYRGKIGTVDEIRVKSSKEEFTLIKKDGKWLSPGAPDLKLDQNKIREILTSLNEIQAKEFLLAMPLSQEKASLSLKSGDKNWSAVISESADKTLYAAIKDPKFLLKLERGKAEELFSMTLMTLRDRREPFDFKNLLVQQIEVETPLKKWSLKKEKEGWRLSGEKSALIEEKNVRNLIARLSESAVTEYLEKMDQSRFVASNKLVLRGEGGEELFRLAWGQTIKKKVLVGERDLVLTKTDLFADVFGLEPSVVESWGLAGLLPKDAQ